LRARIQKRRARHLTSKSALERTSSMKDAAMNKIFSLAAALVLFAPVAAAVLLQASQIVA